MQVDEEFSLALFIPGPGESRWLNGFCFSGTEKEEKALVYGTTGGGFRSRFNVLF